MPWKRILKPISRETRRKGRGEIDVRGSVDARAKRKISVKEMVARVGVLEGLEELSVAGGEPRDVIRLGYAGGLLQCGVWCGLDTKDCDGCASDPHIVQCLRAPIDSSVRSAAEATLSLGSIDNAFIKASRAPSRSPSLTRARPKLPHTL